MKITHPTLALALAAATVCSLQAQQSLIEQFHAHNARLAQVQPTWVGPLAAPDPRLMQGLRLSYSSSYTPAGTRTANWGNYHTLGLVFGDRVQLNLVVPPYIQNHSAAMPDGIGDSQVELKYRLASGNAQHGNYIVTPMLTYQIPTGSHQNGAPSGLYIPAIGAGRAWGRFDLQTSVAGILPAGHIDAQGRQLAWNNVIQMHTSAHTWLELEDNALFNYGGPLNHQTENWLTPGAYLQIRRKAWKPTHPIGILCAGMQIATTSAHIYNHNLIVEGRIAF